MPDNVTDLIEELAIANRILSNEGVIDAFGHVSVRHPADPNRYLLARSRSPLLVEPDDILEYKLDSEPVKRTTTRLYSERVIHGCIYQARSDVMAVCHHHAPAVMPFCISGKPIVPVFHIGATIGEQTPFWDQHDEFGDTNLLVVKEAEGQSLARALGKHSVVLMRRHGATVVGGELEGIGLALDLSLPERRVSDARLYVGRADAAASRRGQACRCPQRDAIGGGADLGILDRAAQSERLLAAEREGARRGGGETGASRG